MPLVAPPLSIYVHMPWCVRKCPYCDFNSHVAPARLQSTRYIDCLLEDLDHDLQWLFGRPIQSIFFGGGTPSLFAPEEIGRFLEGVRRRVTLTANAEITLEANPGAIERGSFGGYRSAGVTRVSLGAQSFDERHLQRLGRIHSSGQIEEAVQELHDAGFDSFNLDLMYGLPDQTVSEALTDLRRAIALRPAHLSHYQLTLEPGTVFFHRPPPLPDDDATWQMQEQSQALLVEAGYRQYEISAYALPGRQCLHNLNYWRFGDYLGLGAGAHGKVTDVETGRIGRTVRQKQPAAYLAGDAAARITSHRGVSKVDLPFEFMLNALRLTEGFSEAWFEGRTGLPITDIGAPLAEAQRLNLLRSDPEGHWLPTHLGHRFLNNLQTLFLPS